MRKEEKEDKLVASGKFLNMSWGKKKGGEVRDRYYFYISNSHFVKDERFPFKDGDTLMLEVHGRSVIVRKGRVRQVVEAVEE